MFLKCNLKQKHRGPGDSQTEVTVTLTRLILYCQRGPGVHAFPACRGHGPKFLL